ncbi:MAG TPA: FlgD immunoglobulin-like domain containing protein [Candidatus Krumholzibacteria bacterium]|nr:FlgD immunoglobulin-like domain containing protein [Candidatus Krumholzibacteria bacterium]HPD72955.1 FlgD immunoglobulin-like domain containing protein [Candidatus Krumholzibacteria bacterium]HRY41754.1 FlgD immunoglobulin-like domain containing protein [Candidatus Krumholzibacteria bacterium]
MKKNSILILGLMVLLLVPSLSHAYSYAGRKWNTNTCYFKYGRNMVSLWNPVWSVSVTAAANTWNNAGSRFRLLPNWTINAGLGRDGYNVICGLNRGNNGKLATTTYWYSGSRVLEADMEFNLYYPWGNGVSGAYDRQNIATHEFGHFLVLNDLYAYADRYKTMYGYAGLGETLKRTLHSDDIAGIRYIYGVGRELPEGPDTGSGLKLAAGRHVAGGAAEIHFSIAAAAHCRVEIFDIAGRRIRTLLDADLDAGDHRVQFDSRDNTGRNLPNGVYLARLSAGNACATTKITVVK